MQMTASNLAVCFAPSLFHLCRNSRCQTSSPKRSRKQTHTQGQIAGEFNICTFFLEIDFHVFVVSLVIILVNYVVLQFGDIYRYMYIQIYLWLFELISVYILIWSVTNKPVILMYELSYSNGNILCNILNK